MSGAHFEFESPYVAFQALHYYIMRAHKMRVECWVLLSMSLYFDFDFAAIWNGQCHCNVVVSCKITLIQVFTYLQSVD